jgi:hypothetical protein
MGRIDPLMFGVLNTPLLARAVANIAAGRSTAVEEGAAFLIPAPEVRAQRERFLRRHVYKMFDERTSSDWFASEDRGR